MKKISDTILAIVRGNTFLEFGVHHQLFNQAQLARYLQPFIESRAQKKTSTNAIAMALSRLTPALIEQTPEPADFQVDKISITTNLCTASYMRTATAHRKLSKLQTDMHKQGAFCSVSEGMKEVTVIVENRFEERLLMLVEESPVYRNSNLASVEILFDSDYIGTPGLLYMLLQRAALQNVNLIEVSSTYSGITLFIAEQDTRILFDTLLNSLMVSNN